VSSGTPRRSTDSTASTTTAVPDLGAARRGRPREPDRTEAILQAAWALLEELGYEDLRVQQVADRAKVGLATIYRRWPTKQALIAGAVRCKDPAAEVPESGDARVDLAAVMRHLASELVDPARARFMVSFLATLHGEPEIAAAFREHIFDEIRARLRSYVSRVVGEDDPDLDLRVDLGPALLFYRSQVLRNIDDPDAAGDEVAAIMLGELPGPRRPTRAARAARA
jgi:AcrR family transcriptional regulator